MEVILLEKIQNLGELGSKVSVRSGYGRNFLIPQGKAIPATSDNVAKVEARRKELEDAAAAKLAAARARAESLAQLSVRIPARVGDEGRLFGSIGTVDIAEAVTAAGVPLAKQEVRLPGGPLRTVGDYEIDLHLHTDVDARVKVAVVPE